MCAVSRCVCGEDPGAFYYKFYPSTRCYSVHYLLLVQCSDKILYRFR
jgi:hypothetical protein